LQSISALSDIAQKIYEEQWVFPAVLSPAVHLDFDPQYFRFPFRTKPVWIASGASGQVHEVEIEKGYLKDWEGCGTVSIMDWELFVYAELSSLRPRRTSRSCTRR
jgi:hypothetical protein